MMSKSIHLNWWQVISQHYKEENVQDLTLLDIQNRTILVPIAVRNTVTKSNLQFIIQGVRAGTQGWDMEIGAGAEVIEEYCLWDCSPLLAQSAFLKQYPGPPCHPQRAGTSYIQKMHYRLAYRHVWWVHYVSVTLTVFFFLIFLCESVLPACKCVYHIGAVPTEARRSPKLELQRVVSYHVGAGH